jgi:hypothetical protein
VLVVAGHARAQDSSSDRSVLSAWSVTLEVGGFVRGNGTAVARWLRDNAYGATEPEHCGFDLLFRRVCDSSVVYPRKSGMGVVALMGSVRRRIDNRLSLELLGATEQAGTVTGRCDDLAVPKDPRCTERFVDVRISGGSLAFLPIVSSYGFHLGAGPALLLANWTMKPAHLAGLWLDGTFERTEFPLFVHVQYRIYRSTTFSPSGGFTGFHPSTLYAGLGFAARTNNRSE